ncbi:ATP-binding protein [Streptosporangium sp. NPDC050855]|uniref:ATP-binding protein n=1 Tax=Streptosporangium sp. NPDC050855 TaxID=3366194 RepID=UPI0037AFF8D8
MSQPLPEVLAALLALCLVATAVVAVRQWRAARALRRRNDELADQLRARDEEARHLVTSRLPALAESLSQPSVVVPGPVHEHLTSTEYGQNLQATMPLLTYHVHSALARADHAARATLTATMRSLQSLAGEQRRAISAMQSRHDHPDVLAGLLEIDHTNAQFGRRAQAIAVLCGSWPGRQRGDVALETVARGATSRIRDYLRVKTSAQTDRAVVGLAVEPVVLAMAELLDNATRHSAPDTDVEVSIESVHNGAVIVIDDRGIGMHEQDKQRATQTLSGADPVDVTRLGNPPKIGFPAIGALARRYGFQVTVDSRSPYGGVRAVVFLPNALLTHAGTGTGPSLPSSASNAALPSASPAHSSSPGLAQVQAQAQASSSSDRYPTVRPAAHPVAQPAAGPAPGSNGYPQRRRLVPDADLQQNVTALTAPAEPARSAERAAAAMGAFQRGSDAARASHPIEHEGNRQ